jgi:hypothetical protein
MKKHIIYISLLVMGIGCSNTSSDKLKVNTIPPKKTYVEDERKSIIENQIKTTTNNSSPHNRRSLSYKNDFGGDFGYFDEYGYYYNSCYFPYINGYSYHDRLYRRGHFSPRVRHIRVCEEDDNGNGYYYPVPSTRIRRGRVAHPEHLEEGFIGAGSYSGLSYSNDREDLK